MFIGCFHQPKNSNFFQLHSCSELFYVTEIESFLYSEVNSALTYANCDRNRVKVTSECITNKSYGEENKTSTQEKHLIEVGAQFLLHFD